MYLNILLIILFPLGLFADWSLLATQAQSQVPLIISDGGVCSGIYIGDKKIITSAHCVPYLISTQVIWPDHLDVKHSADVLAKDTKSDLALIRLAPQASSPAQGFKFRSLDNVIRPLEDIYTIGHPHYRFTLLGDEDESLDLHTFTKGHVSDLSDKKIKLDITAQEGNSGGPILDKNNEVIGVLSQGDRQFAFSPSPRVINEFIEKTKNQSQPLDWRESDWAFDVAFWYANHSYAHKAKETLLVHFTEIAIDYKNKFRFSFAGSNGERIQYDNVLLGYKHPIVFEDGDINYLTMGIEYSSYLLNPTETESDLLNYKRGVGASFIYGSGISGFATKISILSIDDKVENITGFAFYF